MILSENRQGMQQFNVGTSHARSGTTSSTLQTAVNRYGVCFSFFLGTWI